MDKGLLVRILRRVLPHVEHYYHTHPDPHDRAWRVVLAIREFLND